LQVYGAIAFYLANREMIDVYLEEGSAEFQQLQQSLRNRTYALVTRKQDFEIASLRRNDGNA
jgi:hypothetical protein